MELHVHDLSPAQFAKLGRDTARRRKGEASERRDSRAKKPQTANRQGTLPAQEERNRNKQRTNTDTLQVAMHGVRASGIRNVRVIVLLRSVSPLP